MLRLVNAIGEMRKSDGVVNDYTTAYDRIRPHAIHANKVNRG